MRARMARAYRCARPGATAAQGLGTHRPRLAPTPSPCGSPITGETRPPSDSPPPSLRRTDRTAGRGQASANTAVTVTVSCCRPGETGTGEGVADGRAAPGANTGGGVGFCSDMLSSGPSDRPSPFAYWAALALASAAARALAAASREPVSLRLSDTPSTSTALPPARTASLIWVPAVPSVRSVTWIDSLTAYPAGRTELPV